MNTLCILMCDNCDDWPIVAVVYVHSHGLMQGWAVKGFEVSIDWLCVFFIHIQTDDNCFREDLRSIASTPVSCTPYNMDHFQP